MSKNITNILIVGVGGQGIVLSSEVIAAVCMASDVDVKQSEVHGMAQRGGSVSSNVRFGDEVFSPTIEKGKADILLAFELLEGLRWIDYLNPEGIAIVNERRIDPMPVASGVADYPTEITNKIAAKCKDLILVDGQDLAESAGNIKAVNVALLGVLSNHLNFEDEKWLEAILNRVPEKAKDVNLKAFELGKNTKK